MNILKRTSAPALVALALLGATAAHAQLSSAGVTAIPTYESVGLYWTNPGGAAGCEVAYRASGSSSWKAGLAMWYDARNSECRGSLVNLTPGTQYEVNFNLPGQGAVRSTTFRTWANQLPVAKTITVNSANGTTLNITEGGSAAGYVVYQGAAGATLDGQNTAQYNVSVNASYVIVRGLTLKGAKQDAIRVSPNVKDVVIEDNDISGWGRTRDGKWATDMDAGIRAVCSTPSLERLTIQRNKIHDPRYPANSWTDGHPAGAQAITVSYCGGNHVIRWNDIYSATNHFNDAIGGEDNFTTTGFPNRDSDIYGNNISMAWDDAIEAEGGNNNVRIWGNYMDRTATGVATTVTSIGPVYVFRNVWNRNQFYENRTSDTDERQPMFKSGGDASLGHGRRYVLHNTMLQATQAGASLPLGGGAGLGGTGAAQLVENTVSKNNIYHVYKSGSPFYQISASSSFERDMTNGTPSSPVTSGIVATPAYASGNGWQSESGGMYQLAAGTPGHDQAVLIPNFNESYVGGGPDVGAAEAGAGAMKFGVAAANSGGSGGSTPAPSTLSNISTRGQVLTGNDVMIGGFIVGGSAAKTVVVRARGPSLTAAGIPNALSNPVLQLVRSADGAVIANNDNWGSATNAAQISASGYAPSNSLESAVLAVLTPGAYTAIVSGAGGATGVGLIEVFEVDTPASPLINISTRGQVMTGNDVMIGGFIVNGSGPQTVVVRARGPSLVAAGIPNALANPSLQLIRSADNAVIAANDNWASAANAASITASGFAPSNPNEAAILVTLNPGAYTAIVSGSGGGTGVGIVEVFSVN
jgi:hypothetical protein